MAMVRSKRTKKKRLGFRHCQEHIIASPSTTLFPGATPSNLANNAEIVRLVSLEREAPFLPFSCQAVRLPVAPAS